MRRITTARALVVLGVLAAVAVVMLVAAPPISDGEPGLELPWPLGLLLLSGVLSVGLLVGKLRATKS